MHTLHAAIETLPASKFRESTRLSSGHDIFGFFSATVSSSVHFFTSPSPSALDIFTLTLHHVQVLFPCISFYRPFHFPFSLLPSYSLNQNNSISAF